MLHTSYSTDTWALPDIYALALRCFMSSGIVHIYQKKHSSLYYNLYIMHAYICTYACMYACMYIDYKYIKCMWDIPFRVVTVKAGGTCINIDVILSSE